MEFLALIKSEIISGEISSEFFFYVGWARLALMLQPFTDAGQITFYGWLNSA